MIVLLAGGAAERNLHSVNSVNSNARGDLKKARKYVGYMAPDQQEGRFLMYSLTADSKRLVESHWPIIEAVSGAY